MSYSEQDGQVILTMSREDYELLLMAMGYATGAAAQSGTPILPWRKAFGLMDRLNQGNPHYAPYQTGEK